MSFLLCAPKVVTRATGERVVRDGRKGEENPVSASGVSALVVQGPCWYLLDFGMVHLEGPLKSLENRAHLRHVQARSGTSLPLIRGHLRAQAATQQQERAVVWLRSRELRAGRRLWPHKSL